MNNELVFEDRARANLVADMLRDEGYVVMLSNEEKFSVLNFIWSSNGSDRHDIVFADKEEDICPKEHGFGKCFECRFGCKDYEPMKDEDYNLPEG